MKNLLITGLLVCALASPAAFAHEARTKTRAGTTDAEQVANEKHKKPKHKKHKAKKRHHTKKRHSGETAAEKQIDKETDLSPYNTH